MRDDDERNQPKQKWKMEIHSWYGNRQRTGEWIGESVATTMKRTYECFTRGAEWTRRNPVIVKGVFEELVYTHHGYRPKLDGEKKTRKSFFFKGARIWRD